MTKAELVARLEELLETEEGSLSGAEVLEDLDWDSLKIVEFLALADELFSVTLSPKAVGECKTVDDLVAVLSENLTE